MAKEKQNHKRYHSLGIFALITLVIGTLFYHFVENWSYLDALYFSLTTLTTIGYGDLIPTTTFSKVFTIIYIFLGLGIIFSFVMKLVKSRIR